MVASEPRIKVPVAIACDGNAKVNAAVMPIYMKDSEAVGKQEPTSRISLLEEPNNEGNMNKCTVFIDNLSSINNYDQNH